MQIREIVREKKPTLSFEVFPPKTTSSYDSVKKSVLEIAAMKPDFMSVTYGAGGGTSMYTTYLAQEVQKQYAVPAVAHLTCVCSTREMIREQLKKIRDMGIENILALRGDLPKDMAAAGQMQYRYASELIAEIVSDYPSVCIGAACYPEGHPESPNLKEDILHIKEKVAAGCSFLTTQMFFDNGILYRYLDLLEKAGVDVPVIAGIMPITSVSQVERTIKLSGSYLPEKLQRLVCHYENDPQGMFEAGIDYAVGQARELREHGILPIHIYTMNKPKVALALKQALSE